MTAIFQQSNTNTESMDSMVNLRVVATGINPNSPNHRLDRGSRYSRRDMPLLTPGYLNIAPYMQLFLESVKSNIGGFSRADAVALRW
jgi:hypothetical protein